MNKGFIVEIFWAE